jgi:hypothetical protein
VGAGTTRVESRPAYRAAGRLTTVSIHHEGHEGAELGAIAQPGRAGLPISALLARFNEPNAVQLGKAEPFANSTGRGVPVAEETLHAILEGDAIEVK